MRERRLVDADMLTDGEFPEVENEYQMGWNDALRGAQLALPTIDAVEVVHGRWIPKEDGFWRKQILICSNCEARNALNYEFNYCPNCGAKMDGDVGA